MKKKQPQRRRFVFTLADGIKQEIYGSKFVEEVTWKEFVRLAKLLVQRERFGTPLSTRDWNQVKNLPPDLDKALADKRLVEAKYTRTVKDFLYGYRDENTAPKSDSNAESNLYNQKKINLHSPRNGKSLIYYPKLRFYENVDKNLHESLPPMVNFWNDRIIFRYHNSMQYVTFGFTNNNDKLIKKEIEEWCACQPTVQPLQIETSNIQTDQN